VGTQRKLTDSEFLDARQARHAVQWQLENVPLYEQSGESIAPTWIEHAGAPLADIAAIPLEGQRLSQWHVPANCPSLRHVDMDLNAGDDAFVIGFPQGISGGGRLPIWKRASIASEPDASQQLGGWCYVDTGTRQGMSGSPTFGQRTGLIYPRGYEGNALPDDAIIGQGRCFLGVYTSRPLAASTDALAQLGRVFVSVSIDEMIDGNRPGQGVLSQVV
jgi:hypothetical protein